MVGFQSSSTELRACHPLNACPHLEERLTRRVIEVARRSEFGDDFGMRRIEVKQLGYDLTPVDGLALVGRAFA